MKIASIIVLIATLSCTIRIMDHTIYFTNKSRIRIYQGSHYSRNYNVHKVYEQLSKVPTDAIVSAQSPFLPHLAYRDNIYQFPIIKNAEFIIYSCKEEPYPLDTSSFIRLTTTLENSSNCIIKYKDENLTVLKKSGDNKK